MVCNTIFGIFDPPFLHLWCRACFLAMWCPLDPDKSSPSENLKLTLMGALTSSKGLELLTVFGCILHKFIFKQHWGLGSEILFLLCGVWDQLLVNVFHQFYVVEIGDLCGGISQKRNFEGVTQFLQIQFNLSHSLSMVIFSCSKTPEIRPTPSSIKACRHARDLSDCFVLF